MQEAEAEQQEAAKQAKAAAKRAALEAAAAQRAEEASKRHAFMQDTNKVLPHYLPRTHYLTTAFPVHRCAGAVVQADAALLLAYPLHFPSLPSAGNPKSLSIADKAQCIVSHRSCPYVWRLHS